jgi:hypothetical protein
MSKDDFVMRHIPPFCPSAIGPPSIDTNRFQKILSFFGCGSASESLQKTPNSVLPRHCLPPTCGQNQDVSPLDDLDKEIPRKEPCSFARSLVLASYPWVRKQRLPILVGRPISSLRPDRSTVRSVCLQGHPGAAHNPGNSATHTYI